MVHIIIEPNVTIESTNRLFQIWINTYQVFTNNFEAHIDKQLLIWYAIKNKVKTTAKKDSKGYEWTGRVDGSYYYGTTPTPQNIIIKTRDRTDAILVMSCEVNPIHNGHLEMLRITKDSLKHLYTTVQCVISPNYIHSNPSNVPHAKRVQLARNMESTQLFIDTWQGKHDHTIDLQVLLNHFKRDNRSDVFSVFGTEQLELGSACIRQISDPSLLRTMVPSKVADQIITEQLYGFHTVAQWDPKQIKKTAQLLYDCYNPNFAFPTWSMANITQRKTQFQATHVYYGNSLDVNTRPSLDDVKKIVREREPVNIGMSREYNQNKLNLAFGYRTGFYGILAKKTRRLPPSLAIYTLTNVRTNQAQASSTVQVHMVHAIGLAFDTLRQPDYKLMLSSTKKLMVLSNKQKNNCIQFYKYMFRLIFKCADHQIGTDSLVVLSLVGGNNFATEYPPNKVEFWRTVWIPALYAHIQTNPHHGKRIRGMGFGYSEFLPLIKHIFKSSPNKPNLIGSKHDLFPGLLLDYDLTNTLFVNAWDPWSVVGNGNNSDNSLDGHVGRSSDAAILSSGLTNPFLTNDTSYTFLET